MNRAYLSLLFGVLLLAGCSIGGAPGVGSERPTRAVVSGRELADIHVEVKVAGLDDRRFNQTALIQALGPVREGVSMKILGESAEGRTISMLSFGRGPVPVLLWSQMHGDESTATMALADIYSFVTRRPGHPVARAILQGVTVHTIPMLNPDGAQHFQRRNAQGVDVNRDARSLATPEARILKAAVDSLRPRFGFNLHDQSVRTRLGDTDRGVAIALLSPPFDESRAVNDVRERAIKIAGVIRGAIEPLVGGHIARYDDSFTPRAFGDLTTQWGVSTVLVESGGWADDPQKQFLRKVNFVALLAALEAIATGGYRDVEAELYTSLPENGRNMSDLLVTGGTLVIAELPPVRADVLINYADPLMEKDGTIADVGDLMGVPARDTLRADGLYLIFSKDALSQSDEGVRFGPGAQATFAASRTRDGSEVVWRFEGRKPEGGIRTESSRYE